MKDIDIKTLASKLLSIIGVLRKYVVLIFILAFLSIYGFLVLRVNTLSSAEPDEDAITEKLSNVRKPNVDKATLEKIKQLQEQNVEVQTLFKQARDNPFSE
ncbi:hypothetical protein BH23PAT1_BH23PAT1_0830 [soil metagenome]